MPSAKAGSHFPNVLGTSIDGLQDARSNTKCFISLVSIIHQTEVWRSYITCSKLYNSQEVEMRLKPRSAGP